MKFFKTFHKPVLKIGGTGEIIEVGDPLHLVLRDNSTVVVQAATVEKGARRVGWQVGGLPSDLTATSSQNATTAASDDTTGDALANALKTSYNAGQADIATLFDQLNALGSPTSSQNATTAATNDATRLALANALKTNYNAAQVDIAEVFAAYPELGAPTSSQNATPVGSDDATTQTLLNALKVSYNALQVDIAEAFNSLETGGYYQPRSEDVIAVSGAHQYACPAPEDGEYGHLHDGPEDDSAWEPIVNANSPMGAPSSAPAALRETARKPAAMTGKKAEAAASKKSAKAKAKAKKKK